MRLPEGAREEFKRPLGRLIPDSEVTRGVILGCTRKDSILITVGDATSERITNLGLVPRLQIIDGMERRARRDVPDPGQLYVRRCHNPPGGISSDCIDTIRRCLGSSRPTRMVVDGEEDLLVLPVCLYAPDDSVVMYGQPNEGLVIVRVDQQTRDKARSLMEIMR